MGVLQKGINRSCVAVLLSPDRSSFAAISCRRLWLRKDRYSGVVEYHDDSRSSRTFVPYCGYS